MSLKDAERNFKGMGRTIASNTPGPKQLAQGFWETHRPALPFLIGIALLLLFGEPAVRWLTREPAPQQEWECRPQPGYCDIDTDWRPPAH